MLSPNIGKPIKGNRKKLKNSQSKGRTVRATKTPQRDLDSIVISDSHNIPNFGIFHPPKATPWMLLFVY